MVQVQPRQVAQLWDIGLVAEQPRGSIELSRAGAINSSINSMRGRPCWRFDARCTYRLPSLRHSRLSSGSASISGTLRRSRLMNIPSAHGHTQAQQSPAARKLSSSDLELPATEVIFHRNIIVISAIGGYQGHWQRHKALLVPLVCAFHALLSHQMARKGNSRRASNGRSVPASNWQKMKATGGAGAKSVHTTTRQPDRKRRRGRDSSQAATAPKARRTSDNARHGRAGKHGAKPVSAAPQVTKYLGLDCEMVGVCADCWLAVSAHL